MPTLEKAIEIAAQAHAGVKDKQGQPYLLHPLRVMQGVEGLSAQIVAALHDVVEDTPMTLDDIRSAGFDDETIDALDLVTHKRGVSYADYVIASRQNAIATQVKLSDLRDNSNPTRMLLRPEKYETDIARMQRYSLSIRFLTDQISEADYRELMQRLA